jgi:hypothetical protein
MYLGKLTRKKLSVSPRIRIRNSAMFGGTDGIGICEGGYGYLDIVEGTNSRFANRHVEKRDLGKGGKALKREYHK